MTINTKINRQFQALHILGGDTVDWVLKQQVERDVVLLYHQLASYGSITGDLYWGSVFALPYWEYLDWTGLDDSDRIFIRDGCLVMIFTAACGQIDDSGSYTAAGFASCRQAIDRLQPDTPESSKLVGAVCLALDLALDIAVCRSEAEAELYKLSRWVHVYYVRGYFDRISAEFRTNPYFGEGQGDAAKNI